MFTKIKTSAKNTFIEFLRGMDSLEEVTNEEDIKKGLSTFSSSNNEDDSVLLFFVSDNDKSLEVTVLITTPEFETERGIKKALPFICDLSNKTMTKNSFVDKAYVLKKFKSSGEVSYTYVAEVIIAEEEIKALIDQEKGAAEVTFNNLALIITFEASEAYTSIREALNGGKSMVNDNTF